MNGHRVQVTVFLEPQVHQAAKQRAKDMKLSLSATVAEAAKESLLSSYRSDREKEILKAAERNFYAVRRLEQRMRIELQVLKELIGLGMRSFFNHTPPIPDTGKAGALLSGKQRFQRYLDLVASNLRGGDSVLADVPLPELTEAPADAETSGSDRVKPDGSGTNETSHHRERPNGEGGSSTAQPASHKRARSDSNGNHELGLFETSKLKGSHGS
jgi:hypothetical protein